VTPLKLNPAPVVVIWEIVRFTLPVLVIDTDLVPLVPVVTFPKVIDVGLAVSCATGAAAPVPVKDRFAGELGASLSTATLPLAIPVAEGAKFTVNEAVAPAANVVGRVNPVTL